MYEKNVTENLLNIIIMFTVLLFQNGVILMNMIESGYD